MCHDLLLSLLWVEWHVKTTNKAISTVTTVSKILRSMLQMCCHAHVKTDVQPFKTNNQFYSAIMPLRTSKIAFMWNAGTAHFSRLKIYSRGKKKIFFIAFIFISHIFWQNTAERKEVFITFPIDLLCLVKDIPLEKIYYMPLAWS